MHSLASKLALYQLRLAYVAPDITPETYERTQRAMLSLLTAQDKKRYYGTDIYSDRARQRQIAVYRRMIELLANLSRREHGARLAAMVER